MRSSVVSLSVQVAPRVERLKSLVQDIEREARCSAETFLNSQQQAHHEEIIRLLRQGFSTSITSRMLLDQSPYHKLPARKNSAFFGRTEELQRLTSVMHPQSPSTDLLCSCIHGLSGAGKTQLVLEFAYCHIEDYQAILWVPAETPVKISQAFTIFARDLGLAVPSLQHTDQLKDLVLRWLSIRTKKGTAVLSLITVHFFYILFRL